MKNKLLASLALCCATSAAVWAGNWEKPAITQFIDPDLSVPEQEVPTTGAKYLRDIGREYYIYHVASGKFLAQGDRYGTQASIENAGQRIRLGYGHDRLLYDAASYAYNGWVLQMPYAGTTNSGYYELYVQDTSGGDYGYIFTDGFTGKHMLWEINKVGENYQISILKEDPTFGDEGSSFGKSWVGYDPASTTSGVTMCVDGQVDNPQIDWKFVSVDHYKAYEARFTLYDALNRAEAAGFTALDEYAAVYNNASATEADITKAAADLEEAVIAWQWEQASPENPIDVTSRYIKNADGKSVADWTVGGDATPGVRINSKEHWDGSSRGYHDASGDFWGANSAHEWASQTLTLPKGQYRLTAAGRAEANTILNLVVGNVKQLFASVGSSGGTIATDGTEWESVEAGIEAGKSFANGNAGFGWNYTSIEFAMPQDGEIVIGCDGVSTVQHGWFSVADYKLEYIGAVNESVIDGQLSAKIQEAKDVKAAADSDNKYYSNDGGAALLADIAEAEEVLKSGTTEEKGAMISKLADRIAEFEYDVKVYLQMPEKMDEVEAIADRVDFDLDDNFWDYADGLRAAYKAKTFDPKDFDGIIAKAEELFLECFREALNSGLTADVTPLVTNADFSKGATGWNGSFQDASNGYCVEQYNRDFDTYQELTGLPAGIYEISIQGYYRAGGYADAAAVYGTADQRPVLAYVYGNGSQAPIHDIFEGMWTGETAPGDGAGFVQITTGGGEMGWIPNTYGAAATILKEGYYAGNKVQALVTEDGKLRVGMKSVGRSGNANAGSDWSSYRDLKITYLGVDQNAELAIYKAQLEEVLAQAEKVYNSTDIKASADNNALSVLRGTIMIDMDGYTEASQFTDAMAQLNAAIDKVNTGIELIKKYNAQATIYMDLYSSGAYDKYQDEATPELWAFVDFVEEFGNYYDDDMFETIEQVEELAHNMFAAYSAMVMALVPADASAEEPADITDLIMCPSFEDPVTGENVATGWNGATGSLKGDENGGKCYEFWNTNKSFDMNQTLYALPAGWYKLSFNGLYRAGSQAAAAKARHDSIDARNVEYYVETTEGVKVTHHIKSIFDGIVASEFADEAPGRYSDDTRISDANMIEGDQPFSYVPNTVSGAKARYDVGYYLNEAIFEVTEEADVTFGLRKELSIAEEWCPFDNFKLEYTGSEKPVVSVEGIAADAAADVVKSTYYTIGGVRIAKPAQSGLYIREDLLSNGTVKVTKVLVK